MVGTIVQRFGQNGNTLYRLLGLWGHPGTDVVYGWHTPVGSKYAGVVAKIYDNDKFVASDNYTMVSIIVDDGIECFEWQVGHLDVAAGIVAGRHVEKNEIIGFEANHGPVYYNGIRITEAAREAGSQAAHHAHYQKRGLIPVTKTKPGKRYLDGQTSSPYFDGSCYYEYAEQNNGFAGCIDPLKPVLNRSLTIGMSGYDVFVLQRILRKHGFLTAEPTGYFGALTLAALTAWQKANGLTPAPIFGPKSRELALKETRPLPDLLEA